ncbi:MAG TPA: aspartyl protease family protein [Acetobacteraceae bacterium]
MKELALLLVLLLSACAGGGAQVCTLEPAGMLPVRLIDNVPVTIVGINGRPAFLILDIGSDLTLLSRAAALRLGVRFDKRLAIGLDGAGGQARAIPAVLPDMIFGTAMLQNVQAVVGRGLRPPFDGVLGNNVLAGFELDLDAPNGSVALYRARPPACAGAPPPWTVPFTRLPTEQDRNGDLFVRAALNGRPIRALLDTGASRSTVGLPAAAAAGLSAADLRRGPSSVTQSLDAAGIVTRPRRFRSLQVGDEAIDDPVLNVADLPPTAGDMIIGSDYLSSRRIWIALASGTVFAATPDQPRPR